MFASSWEQDIEEARPEPDWRLARCKTGAGALVGLFFSEQLDDIRRAKQICTTCAVQEACFEGALERREPWGVWGGQLFFNGKVLAQKRRRGRPPKNPRPEDQELWSA